MGTYGGLAKVSLLCGTDGARSTPGNPHDNLG